MAEIIIAGASTSGIAAAITLALKGHHITVFDNRKNDDIGYPWEDCASPDMIKSLLGDEIPDKMIGKWKDLTFYSPSEEYPIVVKKRPDSIQYTVDRKILHKLMYEKAVSLGAVFHFETDVTAPIIEDDRIAGIRTSEGNFHSDLLVDALGANSVVRSLLPDYFLIESLAAPKELLYSHRAIYKRVPDIEVSDAPYEIHLYHQGESGLTWLLTDDNFVDVLIGRVIPLTDEKIKSVTDVMRKSRPQLSDELIVEQKAIIPIRRPLGKMVADGYAAIGDAAFMTRPMSGSGINLSIEAAHILAEVVEGANGEYTAKNLWKYNYEYISKHGAEDAASEILRSTLLGIPPADADFLFKEKIISEHDLNSNAIEPPVSAKEKLKRGMKNPSAFFKIVRRLLDGGIAGKVYSDIPKEYDLAKISDWLCNINGFKYEY